MPIFSCKLGIERQACGTAMLKPKGLTGGPSAMLEKNERERGLAES